MRWDELRLPAWIRCSVARRQIRAAMHIRDARLLLVHREQHVFLFELPGIVPIRKRIIGHLFDVTRLDDVVERLRCPLFIERELRDDGTESEKVLPKNRFASAKNWLVIRRYRHGEKDQDHADHDHHLDQREPAIFPVIASATIDTRTWHLPILIFRTV